VQPQGKIVTKESIFSSSFKYLCKTAVDSVNRIIGNRDEVRVRWWPVILLELMWNDPWWRPLLHLLFVAITYGKVSLWHWKSLENSGNFFLQLCGHPVSAEVEHDRTSAVAVQCVQDSCPLSWCVCVSVYVLFSWKSCGTDGSCGKHDSSSVG